MTDARETVERLVETINDHDLLAGRALYSPGARLVTATGHVIDLDGLDSMMAASLRAFPDLRVHIERLAVDGDLVFTEEVMEGTHDGTFAGLPPTGRRVRLPMVHLTRVAAGRVIERVAYHDTAGILRQLQ